MDRVAIIGCGNIGFRHLQGCLSFAKRIGNIEIYCVDNNDLALKHCEEESRSAINEVHLCKKIEELPLNIDVAIIATSSVVRRMLFEKLVAHTKVNSIIFEKVLFQKVEDYYSVEKQLNELGIDAWVNTARRGMECYKKFKEYLNECEDSFEITVTGNNWGLCCNSVHMLDLIAYLSNGYENYSIDEMDLSEKPIESKRLGYYETYGTIMGHAGKCSKFLIKCNEDDETKMNISIVGKKKYEIDEIKKVLSVDNDSIEFNLEYVSHITDSILEQIVQNGFCDLPTYKESMNIHLPFISKMIDYFEEKGLDKGKCPIT